MKPLIVTFILTITFPGEAPKKFEQIIPGPNAIAACSALATEMFSKSEKQTADGRSQSVECKASR